VNVHPLGILRRLLHLVLEPFTWPVQQLRAAATAAPGLVLLVLAVMIFLSVRTARGSRVSALLLIPVSLLWLLVNAPFEGPTLVVISWSHGITGSDLLSAGALALAAWRLAADLLRHVRPARTPS
jgi:Na+-transporting methylmalonyl-CoA/oxaloacetate decarboxylase beta subunit